MAISSASAVGKSGDIAATGPPPPPEQSASSIVGRTVTGSHTLTIDGFSQIKISGNNNNWSDHGGRKSSARSATFTVGGHTWSTYLTAGGIRAGWILAFLRLRCACTHCRTFTVSASYAFSFLDDAGDVSYTVSRSGGKVCTFTQMMPVAAVTVAESRIATYLHGGDRLRVRCDVTVYLEPHCEDRHVSSRLVPVPPSDIGDHFGRLLATGVGADLTFDVAGETFTAHRYILNARSPVLLDEILGSSCKHQLSGVDEARVFKALIHYIYTDSLLEIDEGEAVDMARHLIAAADRYRLDIRLKLICVLRRN